MGKGLIIADEKIVSKIFLIRGQKVMLDRDLAELYGVQTKRLKEQVKRNIGRFPERYMFELSEEEDDSLRSQIATLNRGEHSKYLPIVFTEHGILMLANVLKSERAIQMSIRIIDVYVKMREMIMSHKDVLLKLEQIERKLKKQGEKATKNSKQIQLIFTYLEKILDPDRPPMKKIGYKRYND